jgi:localization factor PodJL
MKFGVPWSGGASEGAAARTAPPNSADDLTGLNKRLDQITQQLQRATRGAEPESHADSEGLPQTVSGRPTTPAPFEERLGRLTAHASSDDEPANPPADPVLSRQRNFASAPPIDEISAALDQAIAEISLRQQMLDREADTAGEERKAQKASATASPFTSQFSGLEKQLRQITTQMESLNHPCGLDEAVAALRQDLGEIGRTLAEAMPRRAIEALEAEVRALSDRVYESRHSGADSA